MFENVLTYPRPRLLESLIAHMGTDEVKVLTGVRRCGKSTLLRMFADRLRANGNRRIQSVLQTARCRGAALRLRRARPVRGTVCGVSCGRQERYVRHPAGRGAGGGGMGEGRPSFPDAAGYRHLFDRIERDAAVRRTGHLHRRSGMWRYRSTRSHSRNTYHAVPCRTNRRIRPTCCWPTTCGTACMPALLAMGPADESRAAEVLDAIFNTIVVKDVASRYGIPVISRRSTRSRGICSRHPGTCSRCAESSTR